MPSSPATTVLHFLRRLIAVRDASGTSDGELVARFVEQRDEAAFVLCHLEGKSNEEAARQLGCPKGTVLSRLARARERLRARLTKRGVTLSAAALAAIVTEQAASAAVPSALAAAISKAASTIA